MFRASLLALVHLIGTFVAIYNNAEALTVWALLIITHIYIAVLLLKNDNT